MSYRVVCAYGTSQIIPVSSVQFSRVVERSGDGRARRRFWRVTLGGTCLPYKGSPNHLGAFWTGASPSYPPDTPTVDQGDDHALGYLRTKLGALANLFRTDGQLFSIQPGDGSAAITFRPRWGEFRSPQGSALLVTNAEWSIDCETDRINPWDPDSVLEQSENPPEESWELTRADEVGRVWTLTHTISATGRRRYDASGVLEAEGWEVARDMITAGPFAGAGATTTLGVDTARVASVGVADLSGFGAYNRKRSEVVDEAQGRVTVTEIWTLFHPSDAPTGLSGGVAIEEYQTETRYSADNGLTSVTVSGTITGLDTDGTGAASRWSNATGRAAGITEAWAKGLAQAESGVTLHPNALSTTLGRNKLSGVVTYSAQFDNRNAPTGAGVLSYQTTVELAAAADVFASLPVPLRLSGPILQAMNTVTAKGITVRTDAVVRTTFGSPPTWPAPNHLSKALSYIGTPTQILLAGDSVNLTEENGRWSRSTSWVYL